MSWRRKYFFSLTSNSTPFFRHDFDGHSRVGRFNCSRSPIVLIVERWSKRARCRILQRGSRTHNVHALTSPTLNTESRRTENATQSVSLDRFTRYLVCVRINVVLYSVCERILQRITMRRQIPSNTRQCALGVPLLVVKRLRLLLVWSFLPWPTQHRIWRSRVFVRPTNVIVTVMTVSLS